MQPYLFILFLVFVFVLLISQDAAHLQYDRSMSILRRAQVYAHTPGIHLYTLTDR